MRNRFCSYRPGILIWLGDFRSLASRFLSIFFVKFGRVLVIDRIRGPFRFGPCYKQVLAVENTRNLGIISKLRSVFGLPLGRANVFRIFFGRRTFLVERQSRKPEFTKSSQVLTVMSDVYRRIPHCCDKHKRVGQLTETNETQWLQHSFGQNG